MHIGSGETVSSAGFGLEETIQEEVVFIFYFLFIVLFFSSLVLPRNKRIIDISEVLFDSRTKTVFYFNPDFFVVGVTLMYSSCQNNVSCSRQLRMACCPGWSTTPSARYTLFRADVLPIIR